MEKTGKMNDTVVQWKLGISLLAHSFPLDAWLIWEWQPPLFYHESWNEILISETLPNQGSVMYRSRKEDSEEWKSALHLLMNKHVAKNISPSSPNIFPFIWSLQCAKCPSNIQYWPFALKDSLRMNQNDKINMTFTAFQIERMKAKLGGWAG